MTNATITASVFANPSLEQIEGMDRYRQSDNENSSFYRYMGSEHFIASLIWHEAQREDVLRDAYAEKAAREAGRWEDALLAPFEDKPILSTYEKDQQAALAQAEILGASADQRAKLRAIVEAEHTSRREVERLTSETVRLTTALQLATVPIEDPSDERLMPIFQKAAIEANAQGYCSVYDQISSAVGIPTRDDLVAAGYSLYNERPGRVEVQVTVSVWVDVDDLDDIEYDNDDVDEAVRDYLSSSNADSYSLTGNEDEM